MRVAIYARFSSDLQDIRSIVDQIAAARDYAERQGLRVVAEFSDAAISGSSLHNRPGLLDLMLAAQAKQFDAVLTESMIACRAILKILPGCTSGWPTWASRS